MDETRPRMTTRADGRRGRGSWALARTAVVRMPGAYMGTKLSGPALAAHSLTVVRTCP